MKFILTLLITVSAAAFLNAQTAAPAAPAQPVAAPADAPVAPAAPAEPTKKISYEVVPAKRVVTPTADRPADLQPADISELKKTQDQQKVNEAIQKRNAPVNNTLTPAQAPPQKAAPAGSAPKE